MLTIIIVPTASTNIGQGQSHIHVTPSLLFHNRNISIAKFIVPY